MQIKLSLSNEGSSTDATSENSPFLSWGLPLRFWLLYIWRRRYNIWRIFWSWFLVWKIRFSHTASENDGCLLFLNFCGCLLTATNVSIKNFLNHYFSKNCFCLFEQSVDNCLHGCHLFSLHGPKRNGVTTSTLCKKLRFPTALSASKSFLAFFRLYQFKTLAVSNSLDYLSV